MQESLLHSVIITVDGQSKAGTTAVIGRIGAAAEHQETFFSEKLALDAEIVAAGERGYDGDILAELEKRHRMVTFDKISVIPGGNFYRAAALYIMLCDLKGEPKASLDETDADSIKEILALDGIQDVLDYDPNIGKGVSDVFARYAGAQALCSSMLCEAISDAYGKNGRGSLVVVDARDPLGHMERNGILGILPTRIDQNSLVPLYVETPAEVAGRRMAGNPEENTQIVIARRQRDATREENPVLRPDRVVEDLSVWSDELDLLPPLATAEPFLVVNDEAVRWEDLDALGAIVVARAQKVGEKLYTNKTRFGLMCRGQGDDETADGSSHLVYIPDARPAPKRWP